MHDVDKLSAFFDVIQQDPVVSQVKPIAEPWTSGGRLPGGRVPTALDRAERQVRDSVRDLWRGHGHGLRELAYRLSGSSDLYQDDGRRPYASINFVTDTTASPCATSRPTRASTTMPTEKATVTASPYNRS